MQHHILPNKPFLKKMETREIHNWSKCKQVAVGCPAPNGISIILYLYLWLREHHGRGNVKNTRGRKDTGHQDIAIHWTHKAGFSWVHRDWKSNHGVHWYAPCPLHVYYGFHSFAFMGLLKCENKWISDPYLFSWGLSSVALSHQI